MKPTLTKLGRVYRLTPKQSHDMERAEKEEKEQAKYRAKYDQKASISFYDDEGHCIAKLAVCGNGKSVAIGDRWRVVAGIKLLKSAMATWLEDHQ